MPRARLLVLAAVVLLVVGVAVVVLVVRRQSSPLSEAVGSLPSGTLRVSFTDWSQMGSLVPGPSPRVSSSAGADERWLEKAFDRGLTSASSLTDSFHALGANFGVTPLSAEWEAYGQSRDGSVALLRLSDSVDVSRLEDRFRDLGYTSASSGVWAGTPELVAGLDEPLTQLQMNVAVVPSEHLLLMSDSQTYAESALAALNGGKETLSADALVSAAGDPVVAEMWMGDFACEDLAMSQADPQDVEAADSLVESAGGVHPLSGLVMAQQPDSTLRVGMVFDSSSAASADLQPRTDLASGPAPGQGGTFPERFTVTSSSVSDDVITMTFEPKGDRLLDDLGQGPVLFATC